MTNNTSTTTQTLWSPEGTKQLEYLKTKIMTELEIEQLTSSVEFTILEWSDKVDNLSAKDVGLLMYKLIEKNVTHDATQRHMMYDVLDALEQHIG